MSCRQLCTTVLPPSWDALEPRRLLAGSPATVPGSAGDDDIQISVSGANMNVRVNGVNHLLAIASTSDITILAGGGRDSISLESTQVPLSIFGEADDDDLTLTATGGDVTTIAAPVSFDGAAGRDRLTIWDDLRPASFNDTYTFLNASLLRGATTVISFTTIEDMDFRGGPGNNTLFINAAPASLTNYDVYAGSGDDTFVYGNATNTLDALLGLVEIHGELDTDSVAFNDTSNATNATWTITSLGVSRTGWAGARYNTSELITINAGSGNETFAIESTRAGTSVVINAGGGTDTFNLTPTSHMLEDIVSPLTVNGQGGTDQLVLFDESNTFADTYTVTKTNVTRTFFDDGVNYAAIEGVRLNSGTSGAKTFNVSATTTAAPLALSAGGPDNVVHALPQAASSAEVVLSGTTRLTELSIGAGGVVRLAPGGASTLVTQSLALTGDARLDVTDNSVIVNYSGTSPLGSIRAALTAGYAGGAWDGSGIFSATAHSTPQHAVGYAEASALFSAFPVTFGGQSVDDNTAVLLRFTRNGDANLDGLVNVLDFGRLASSFGNGLLWNQGNFNFDTTVNVFDFSILASNFGQNVAAAAAIIAARQTLESGDDSAASS